MKFGMCFFPTPYRENYFVCVRKLKIKKKTSLNTEKSEKLMFELSICVKSGTQFNTTRIICLYYLLLFMKSLYIFVISVSTECFCL